MIEPIGFGEQQLSPYDRYIQYQQLRRPAALTATSTGGGGGALSTQAAKPSSAAGQLEGILRNAMAAATGQTEGPGQIQGPGQTGAPGMLGENSLAQPQAKESIDAGSARSLGQVADRECQTCKNRKYQDQSDDPGVSYQTPTKIGPDAAGAAVRAHENEHVVREQGKAKRQGREVVSQSVVLKTAICPECGRVYISGGTTTTVTRATKDKDNPFQVGESGEKGGLLLNKKV